MDAAGVPHPATLANTGGAILIIIGGPLVTRALRHIMLGNRVGTR